MKTLKVLLQEVVSGIKAWVNSNFAQESNAVHKTGDETVNGDKTLTGATTFSGNVACDQNCQFTKRVNPSEITGTSDCNLAFNALNNVVFFNTRGSSNYKGYGSFLWTGYNSGDAPDRYGQIQLLRSTDKYGDTNDGRVPDPTFKMWRVATYYNVMDFMESVRVMNLDSYNYMIPLVDNATDLGTSDNRWKSLNGVNPGALSLPKVGAQTDFSGDVIPPTGESGINISGDFNTFTPEFDGWISIRYNHATMISVVRSVYRSFGNVLSLPSEGEITLSMPVIANETYRIRIIATETNQYTHFFFTKSKGDPTNP